MMVDQRREATPVIHRHAITPGRLRQHFLDEQGIRGKDTIRALKHAKGHQRINRARSRLRLLLIYVGILTIPLLHINASHIAI